MSNETASLEMIVGLEDRIRRHLSANGPVPYALPFWVSQPVHRTRFYEMLERIRANGMPYAMTRRVDDTEWIVFTL